MTRYEVDQAGILREVAGAAPWPGGSRLGRCLASPRCYWPALMILGGILSWRLSWLLVAPLCWPGSSPGQISMVAEQIFCLGAPYAACLGGVVSCLRYIRYRQGLATIRLRHYLGACLAVLPGLTWALLLFLVCQAGVLAVDGVLLLLNLVRSVLF